MAVALTTAVSHGPVPGAPVSESLFHSADFSQKSEHVAWWNGPAATDLDDVYMAIQAEFGVSSRQAYVTWEYWSLTMSEYIRHSQHKLLYLPG